MKKILFFGDSITDMRRVRGDEKEKIFTYGAGYVFLSTAELQHDDPTKYFIINRGIGGNRSVDMYARIKCEVWNQEPDVLSILAGINDVWHDLKGEPRGVELDRFERIYRMMIEDTLERLPNLKIMILEPFVLRGTATDGEAVDFAKFEEVKKYAKVVKKLAEEYNLFFVPLQEKFDEASKKYDAKYYLYDGVHPDMAGACLIAREWLKVFHEKVEPELKK